METRQQCGLPGYFISDLVGGDSLCVSTNNLNITDSEEDLCRENSKGITNSSSMGITALLSQTQGNAIAHTNSVQILPSTSYVSDYRTSTPSESGLKTNLFYNKRAGEHLRPDLGASLDKLSDKSLHYLENSVKVSTQRHYFYAINKWKNYCSEHGFDYQNTSLVNIVNYLVLLFDSGLKYTTINLARSAISSTHSKFNNLPVGQSDLVCKTLAGIKNTAPPIPRYAETWNIDKVLNIFEEVKWASSPFLNIKDLSKKTAMLILICTACRISVLKRLSIVHIKDLGDRFALNPLGYDKTGSFSKPSQTLYLTKFSEAALCPYRALKAYLKVRPKVEFNSLFVSSNRKRSASQYEINGWISELMHLAEVPNNFKPHSIRGAATSKAHGTLPTSVILEAANWKGYDTFRKYYLKSVTSTNRGKFQSTVLDL